MVSENIFSALLMFRLQNVSVCSGMGAGELEKLKAILKLVPEIEYICLVGSANGYSVHFHEVIKQVRKQFPRHTIIVCTFYFLSFVT